VSERIEVYKDMAGEWRWRRIAGNGLNIANSSEGYKNLTHCLEMAQHEWARLKANGAKECRQCHKLEAMDNPDMPFVKDEHEAALKSGQICTDCHQGVAHTPPGKVDVAQHP